jgi:hypothetical protein
LRTHPEQVSKNLKIGTKGKIKRKKIKIIGDKVIKMLLMNTIIILLSSKSYSLVQMASSIFIPQIWAYPSLFKDFSLSICINNNCSLWLA